MDRIDVEIKKAQVAAARLLETLVAARAGRDLGVPVAKGMGYGDPDDPMRAELARIAEESPEEAIALAAAAGINLPGAGGLAMLRARTLERNRARGLSESEALIQSAAEFPRLWTDPAVGTAAARPARVTKATGETVAVLAHQRLEALAKADCATDPEAHFEICYEKRASQTEAGRACAALIGRGRGVSLADARDDADLGPLVKRAGL